MSILIRAKTNEAISAPELRVVGSDGTNLGTMSRVAALELARQESLDLIEVAPLSSPPVARIMSFDKFRYEQEKAWKKQRLAKPKSLKQVQISVRGATNDLLIKARKIEEFFGEGHKVEVRMRLRGRERGNPDFARQKLNDFLKLISVDHRATSEIKSGGFGLTIQIEKR
ncbi:MAG: translation initiation factor IF-3 [Candidatus Colwellbacteria bacterium]|nr:translation initiation factor IF-3 [Candidatus Colwellbacteria bacterium]